MTVTGRQKGEKMSRHTTSNIHHNYILLDRIIKRCQRSPRIAILMSGTGSNARKILESWRQYPNFDFVAIATDRPTFHAATIAREYGLHYVLVEQWGQIPFDRKAFFDTLSAYLRKLRINFLIYAGFLKIAPKNFLTEFPGINIHPADLTIVTKKGTPKYTGISTVSYAVNAGESYIASTVHVVEETVDNGIVIAVSKHVPLLIQGICDTRELQEELKRTGEHTLYPQVLALLSRGKITRDMLPLRAENQDLNALIK